ncbi:MAG: cyclase family protein [Gemmatimonadetes bacterium]|nr:cyclase family protein [Gemmatimonadota bacterium]
MYRKRKHGRIRRLVLSLILATTALCLLASSKASAQYMPVGPDDVVDLSPVISGRHYQYWPGGQIHHQPLVVPYIVHGDRPWASDLIILDENTATQTDTPAHMMPPQHSGLPNAHYWGDLTVEKVPAWQLVGEVYKIDGRSMLDQAPPGVSPLFTIDVVKAAEAAHRPMGPGDAVLYWSGYDDRHDRPAPDDRRLIVEPVVGTAPGWPAPDYDAAEYVGSRGVWLMGIDSPSMGGLGPPRYIASGPDGMYVNPLALESHLGHFKHGAVHTEGLINLDRTPNGSLYIALPVKHENSPTVETRAVAITNPDLAARLLEAVKSKRVVDLSVTLSMDRPVWWPGRGVGRHVFPYSRVQPVNYFDGPFGPYWVNTHFMDAHTGTHVDPPAHYGPPPGFDTGRYDETVRAALREFEAEHGPLKRTEMTTEKVPLHHFMGPARVVNVQHRVGTTSWDDWPASPAITLDDVRRHEDLYGEIEDGEVVLFHTGHTDTHFRRFIRVVMEQTVKAPLDGQSEGWPAPGAEVIAYLAGKGVKHVGIDTPDMGSVDPVESMKTHWTAVNHDMIFTEYLIGVGQLPPKGAFFIFLCPHLENNHGGPGRAIAILP